MKLIFEGQKPQTGDAYSFTFRPVTTLEWTAGQSIKLEVPGSYGPLEHRFTIASAPYEKFVTITTRLSGSDYKNSLAALKPGSEVDAYSVDGDFIWRQSPASHIFVAAGIGITPFHSILKQRAHEQLPLTATLIYGSSQADMVYKNELDNWAKQYSSVFTIKYIAGRHLIASDIPKTKGLVYLSGPSIVVDELSTELIKNGLSDMQLVRDWFTGRLVA